MIKITHEPVAIQQILADFNRDANGAVVTFIGTVRNNSEGKKVLYLEYECYEPMAVKKLNEIADEIKRRWKINDISVIHRVGRLEIGDTAIVIAVGSPHRQEAFEACKYAIDTIKETVPIWKKEFYENGSSWIGHP